MFESLLPCTPSDSSSEISFVDLISDDDIIANDDNTTPQQQPITNGKPLRGEEQQDMKQMDLKKFDKMYRSQDNCNFSQTAIQDQPNPFYIPKVHKKEKIVEALNKKYTKKSKIKKNHELRSKIKNQKMYTQLLTKQIRTPSGNFIHAPQPTPAARKIRRKYTSSRYMHKRRKKEHKRMKTKQESVSLRNIKQENDFNNKTRSAIKLPKNEGLKRSRSRIQQRHKNERIRRINVAKTTKSQQKHERGSLRNVKQENDSYITQHEESTDNKATEHTAIFQTRYINRDDILRMFQ